MTTVALRRTGRPVRSIALAQDRFLAVVAAAVVDHRKW